MLYDSFKIKSYKLQSLYLSYGTEGMLDFHFLDQIWLPWVKTKFDNVVIQPQNEGALRDLGLWTDPHDLQITSSPS